MLEEIATNRNKDIYSMYTKEREKYYNRNDWGLVAIEDLRNKKIDIKRRIREREWDIQKQMEESKMKVEKYNKRYKEIGRKSDNSKYLLKESIDRITVGDEIRALIKIRCSNIEKANKYWLGDKHKICVFCKKRQDSIEHYVKKCIEVSKWFKPLGENVNNRIKRVWS